MRKCPKGSKRIEGACWRKTRELSGIPTIPDSRELGAPSSCPRTTAWWKTAAIGVAAGGIVGGVAMLFHIQNGLTDMKNQGKLILKA